MNLFQSLLLYPGLLFTLVLGAAYRGLVERDIRGASVKLPRPGFEATASVASVLLAALGLALLPWPFSPVAGAGVFGSPLASWLAFEGAFLLPLLPGLLAESPLASRAALREAQIGLAGRVIFWLAAGALWQSTLLSTTTAPGWLLLALGGVLALPAAIGFGPFGADRALTPSGAEHGLDAATAGLARMARTSRAGAITAALALAIVPQTQIRPPLALLLWGAITLLLLLVLRRLNGRLPRLALPNALRWCWLRALPVAAVGLVYLALVQQ